MPGVSPYDLRWSDEDTSLLIAMCEAGTTKAKAAKVFNCSVKRVESKGKRLGLSFLRENSWTDEEIAQLEDLAARGKTSFEIAGLVGRTSGAVESKAKAFGISLVSMSDSGDVPERHGDTWTGTDEKLLEDSLEAQYSVDELVTVLERTPKAIRSHMGVLGLKLCCNS